MRLLLFQYVPSLVSLLTRYKVDCILFELPAANVTKAFSPSESVTIKYARTEQKNALDTHQNCSLELEVFQSFVCKRLTKSSCSRISVNMRSKEIARYVLPNCTLGIRCTNHLFVKSWQTWRILVDIRNLLMRYLCNKSRPS